MRFKWFARLLTAAFIASTLLQSGSEVLAAEGTITPAAMTAEASEGALEEEEQGMPSTEEAPSQTDAQPSQEGEDGGNGATTVPEETPVTDAATGTEAPAEENAGASEGNAEQDGDSEEEEESPTDAETPTDSNEEGEDKDGESEEGQENSESGEEEGQEELDENIGMPITDGSENGELDGMAAFSLPRAADDIASGQSGDIEWVIDASGKLTVSGSGDCSGEGRLFPWYEYREEITSAEISVTGMMDARGMFNGCRSLTSLDLSGFDTSNVTDMGSMFNGCSSLTSLDVSGFDTGNVTYMDFMFANCSSLTSLDLSGFDTSNVVDMVFMFVSCSSLTSMNLSGFDTSKVLGMASMFYGCENLQSIDLSGLDTSNVTSMKDMFLGCTNLTDLDLSGFNTSNVVNMEEMFLGCKGLTDLSLNNFDTSNVTNMMAMFRGCQSLKHLDVSSFNTSSVEKAESMFYGCSSLESLDLHSFDLGNAASLNNMLDGCSNLTEIKAPCHVTKSVTLPASSVASTVWRLSDGTEITELPQNLDSSVTITRYDVENDIIYVSTTEELITAIGSSRTIILKDGIYEMDSCLQLTQMKDLVIRAENPGRAELLSHDGFNPVISLQDCVNTEISGCILGHDTVDVGGCGGYGYVIAVTDSSSIKVMDCDLYGCGMVGLVGRGTTDNIIVEDCVIRDCMDSAVEFESGSFRLTNCIISGNSYSGPFFSAFYALKAGAFADSLLEDCIFLSNYSASFVFEGTQPPAMTGCTFHDNVWDGGTPGEYGICLNGLTWQMDGDVLKLGYPLQFDDGTVIESAQTQPLPYSDFSLPWRKCHYSRIMKAWEESAELTPAVKFVPYEAILTEAAGQEGFALTDGALPAGLELAEDGRIHGVPVEQGTFSFAVNGTRYSLTVNANTENNFGTYADPGYELSERVPNLYWGEMPDGGSQLMVSVGPYDEFEALYLDGELLERGVAYTAEPGSTRITIRNQTLKSKGSGTHTLAIEFRTRDARDLRWVAQNYTIVDGSRPSGGNGTTNPGGTNPGGAAPSSPGGSPSQNSGDGSSIGDEGGTGIEENAGETVTYVVRTGDSLWKIARRLFGAGTFWRRIYEQNKALIRNPNLIRPGMALVITLRQDRGAAGAATSAGGRYTVRLGDSLYRIAQRIYGQGRRWVEIFQANIDQIADPNRIYSGQIITIPED